MRVNLLLEELIPSASGIDPRAARWSSDLVWVLLAQLEDAQGRVPSKHQGTLESFLVHPVRFPFEASGHLCPPPDFAGGPTCELAWWPERGICCSAERWRAGSV